MEEVISEKREELHDDLVISRDLAAKERDTLIN